MTFPQTLTATEANKETPINEQFGGVKWAGLFSNNPDTTTGVVFGLNGGPMMVDGVLTTIADQTVTCAVSTTNYVEITRAGVASTNTTDFTAGKVPLYVVTTSASGVSSFVDWRVWADMPGVAQRLSVSVAGGANVTLTAAQARNEILNFTGLLTGNINVIVPNGPQVWTVTNNTTGAFTLTVKTSGGTGIAVTQTKALDLAADGTNVIATNNDAVGVGSGTVTSVAASVPAFLSVAGSPITTAGTLAISYSGTALPVANGGTGITAFGTGVATALGVNVGGAGAVVVNGGALGTPASGTLTNATGLPVAGGGTGVATLTAYAPVFGGTTGTGAVQSGTAGTSGHVLTSNGAGVLPTFQAAASGSVATDTIWDVAGDLVQGTGSNTAARLAIGTALQVLRVNSGATAVEWAAASGGGTKTYAVLNAMSSQPPASNYATLDTRNSIAVLEFDAATDESTFWTWVVPEAASLGSGLKIEIHWMADTATSGTCRWGVQIERMNTDLDSDSFDTAATAGGTANGTSGIITVTEITITTIDSIAAGESFRLKVYRDADGTSGTDDMTGDAQLVNVEVRSAA